MHDDEPLEFPEYFLAPATMLIAMMNITGRDEEGVALVEDLYRRYALPENWLATYTSWEGDGETLLSTDTSTETIERLIPVLGEMSRPRARALLRLMERMAGRNGEIDPHETEFYNRIRDVVADKIPYFDPEAEKQRISQYEHLQPGPATDRQMIGGRAYYSKEDEKNARSSEWWEQNRRSIKIAGIVFCVYLLLVLLHQLGAW